IGGWQFVMGERATGDIVALGVPVWVVGLVFPLAFGLIAIRLLWRASPKWSGRAVAALGIVGGALIVQNGAVFEGRPALPWVLALIATGALGMPIFALLGGIAVFLFLAAGTPPLQMLLKAHEELTSSSGLAAIPLFTLAGFLFAEGKSS